VEPAGGRVTYSIEAEDLLIERLFYALIEPDPGHKGFFVDIGAYDPVRASNTFLLYQKGWSGVNVDPNPEAIRRFREQRPRDTAVHAAIGRDGEEGNYLMFDEPLLNGFLSPDMEARHVAQGNRILERVPVEFRSVGSLLAEFAPPGIRIDLLNIDVELMEHSILSDWDFSIWRPRIIAIEIHGPLAVTELAKDQSVTLLVERGYVFLSRLWHTSIFLDRNSIRSDLW
jgi:FkbM family methyltransferase